MMIMDEHLREILDLHFDPAWGAPYWLHAARELGFDPRRDIETVDDLGRFPEFPLEELATRPVTDFIPRRYHDQLSGFVTAETGGATGAPKCTAYHPDDFYAAFVAPFIHAAELLHFPRDRHWLFVGPSGPHVIGKAARYCAAALGSIDPFSVDFDPRWVRKLPLGSLGRTRYLDHVLDQALRVVAVQEIGVIFSTPPVLEALGQRMPAEAREQITGIHLGGMAPEPGFWERLGAAFPNAVTLSGYGNSLAGVCPEVSLRDGDLPVYVAHGSRLALGVKVGPGESRGPVCFHRLDRACFLPHVVEGDEAERCDVRAAEAVALGFHTTGIRDPRPAARYQATRQEGLY